ncbi:MAG: hypothetical protein Q8910_02790 [Bacteroidota bacterium]|nr:hypothetical protein [Bacteroidota bacterium]
MEKSRHQVDHIYYNGTLFNSSFTNSIPAQINDVLNGALLEKGHDWYVSVIRIGVSGHALPIASILNYLVDPLAPAPYVTKFTVSLSYLGLTQTTPVIFVPITDDTPTKFYIYTYQHWLNCINQAYVQCKLDWAFYYGGGLNALVNQTPFIAYDSSQNLFSLYCESGYDSNVPNPIGVYMNRLLYDYFDSFEIVDLAGYSSPVGLDVRFNISSNTCNNFSPLPIGAPAVLSTWVLKAGQTIYQMKQQYPSAYAWNIIRSLVLTSSIGVQNESIPISNSANPSISNSNLTILTDFESNLSQDNNSGSRGFLQYVPTAQYRYVDITNSTIVQSISMTIYYVDFSGKLTQLVLNPRYGMSVKLLFSRKSGITHKIITD